MGKNKYRFNTQSLTYEKVEHSTKKIILMGITYIVIFIIIGFAFMFIWLYFFPSAREFELMEENAALRNQYSILDSKIERLENLYTDIAQRDNDIYRVIFEANPISDQIRNSGANRGKLYTDLQKKTNNDIVLECGRQLDVLEKKVYIQSLSFDTIIALAQNKKDMLQCIPAIQPVKNYKYISGFGYRMHPIYKTLRLHSGVDLSAPIGTKVYATGNGVVKKTDYARGYGKMVLIDHGYNYQTVYAHLSKMLVKPGQKITRGDVVGLVGNTGISTGAHLHYEVRYHGTPVNPVNYYINDLTPAEFDVILQLSKETNQSFD